MFEMLKTRLRSALANLLQKRAPFDWYGDSAVMAVAGSNLTDEQAAKLEKRIESNPDNIEGRILLLGKYCERQFDVNNSEVLRLKHVEWIVRNRPEHSIAGTPFVEVFCDEDEEGYQRIKDIWLKQIDKHKNNVAVLSNAANFFILEDQEIAERCLLQALIVKPSDTGMRRELAQLYSLWDGHSEQALAEYEKISKKPGSKSVFYESTHLPTAAFKAGQFEKAIIAAQRLLELAMKNKRHWNYGNAVNEAHTVLGRIAVKRGDIEEAKYHLKESIIELASPQTKSFGPSLDLAGDLLAAGEKAAVLEYLDEFELLCGVDNQWAFAIRFQAERGQESMEVGDRHSEAYDDAFREHQLRSLEARSPEKRQKHLADLIEQTRDQIEAESQIIEQEGELGSEELREAQVTKKREQEHLRKLELLLPADGQSKP
jgi:tetratricopeptide (TPR) repeat protein